jgi:hypothetical protein
MEPARAKGLCNLTRNLVSEMTACRCMFVEFKNVDDANLALATIHNHPFDARHTFKVNRFTDIEEVSHPWTKHTQSLSSVNIHLR